MRDLEKGSLIYVECDSRMVNVPIPGEVEGGKTRKALNLVQREFVWLLYFLWGENGQLNITLRDRRRIRMMMGSWLVSDIID